MENGTKYPTWVAANIILGIVGVIMAAIFALAGAAYSTAQDNRIGLAEEKIKATSVKEDISEIRKDVKTLLKNSGF